MIWFSKRMLRIPCEEDVVNEVIISQWKLKGHLYLQTVEISGTHNEERKLREFDTYRTYWNEDKKKEKENIG